MQNKLSNSKATAWKHFAMFIKLRDCFLTTGTFTRGICVSCGVEFPIKELQAGHFIPGRNNSLLLDEDMVHAQCINCNENLKGNPDGYLVFMNRVYGEEAVKRMRNKKWQVVQIKDFEWLEKAEDYKSRVKYLKQHAK